MALVHELTEDDYTKYYGYYLNFNNKNGVYNSKIKIKDLGTDIFYYGDGKHDNIFAKYKPEKDPSNPNKYIIKLKTRQNYLDLYDDLLKVNDNLNSDNYVVIDVISFCDNIFKSSLSNCILYNNFGIEYMLRRYFIKQKNLHIYNNEIYFKLNNVDICEQIFFDKLIDDLFNPNMYIGEGRGTSIKFANADEFNTQINIGNRLFFYINKLYRYKIKNVLKSSNYITYENNKKILINAINKKIFAIGDIHGDFPRLVQILYNAGFIKFEGVAWNNVNLSNEHSYKTYLHSTNIFKEIKWIAKNTIFLFTGDLLDSTGRTDNIDADDETGDYELRIYLMILILRIQAIEDKNSFVHFVIGNHDHDIVKNLNYNDYVKYNYYNDNVGIKSSNKLFNSVANRNNILINFIGDNLYDRFFMTYYLYIEYSSDKYIFLSHGSLCDCKEIIYDVNVADSIQQFKNNIKSVFFSRSSILECYLDGDKTKYKIDENIYDLYSIYIDLKFNINETENITNFYNNLTNYIKKYDINQFSQQQIDTNLINEIFNTTSNIVKPNLSAKQIMNFLDKLCELDGMLYNKKYDDYKDYKNAYIFKNNTFDPYKNINYYIFGHNITTNEQTLENLLLQKVVHNQTNYENHHTILSTCNSHCFFVDTGLSKAFDYPDDSENNNEFYELVYLDSAILAANDAITDSKNKNRKATAHLRVYTDKNRFKLGSRQAELFYDSDDTKADFTPKLEDIGVPIGDLLSS